MNRIKIAYFSPNQIVRILRTGSKITILQGLPKDACLVGANFDIGRNQYQLVFRSETFEPIEPGLQCPVLDILIKED